MQRNFLYALGLLPFVLFADVEKEHLKFYASFDKGAVPEIGQKNALPKPGEYTFVPGKSGNGIYFSKETHKSNLSYNVSNALRGPEWTIAVWLKLDENGTFNYGKGPARTIFRTNSGWKNGNVWSLFDPWAKLSYSHFGKDKKVYTTNIFAKGFQKDIWYHLAYTCKNGKHSIFINGSEAKYLGNKDVDEVLPCTRLQLGRMDDRSETFLNGTLDELKLFDKALNAEEVKSIMNPISSGGDDKISCYLPLDGTVSGRGFESFSTAELLFAKGKSNEGAKMIRHGYDRRAILDIRGIKMDPDATSFGFYFLPDWAGSNDKRIHGLMVIKGSDFTGNLTVQNGKISFMLENGGKKQSVSLDSNLFEKGKTYLITAGYDFRKAKIYLSVDHKRKEEKLILPKHNASSVNLIVGDTLNGDTYSITQAEGVIDEIIFINEYFGPSKIENLIAEEIRKKGKSSDSKLVLSPVKPIERKLWDLSGAEKKSNPTRTKISLNALWRCQLTNNSRKFDPEDWDYLALPGRWSGSRNGGASMEFHFRDKKLKKRKSEAYYAGASTHRYVNGWFERAFKADPAWKNKTLILKCDELASSVKADFYLNGKKIASMPVGSTYEIPIDVSKLDFEGDNFLTIHMTANGRYWEWRGMKGDIYFELRDSAVHTLEPAVTTSIEKQNVTASVTVQNPGPQTELLFVEAVIEGENAPRLRSREITLAPGENQRIELSAKWTDPRLWDTDSPILYGCRFRVLDANGKVLDESWPFRFGFREFKISGRDFLLNGKKIHLHIFDQWCNGFFDSEMIRRTAREMKKLGFNTLRTAFSSDEVLYRKMLDICDEEGILVLFNAKGVDGSNYAVWNDPETRRKLEEQMKFIIRRFQNHPCIVTWYLSINFLGCNWGAHPLKMADGYVPKHIMNKVDACMDGVAILHKYDRSRPYFFQAGGPFGDIHTSNIYFCWWPQTERNAWPEEWFKMAEKPYIPIETSFPYLRSFYGMDLKYRGKKPFFFYENLARYYGPAVYAEKEPEIQKEIIRSGKDQDGVLWRDSALLQKLKYDLLTDTIPYWRGFDISGFCPFEEYRYGFETHAPRHTSHVSKKWPVKVDDFRRFGFSPDVLKIPYQRDIDFSRPQPTSKALAKSMAEKLVFIDGGLSESPVDKQCNYYAGDLLDKRIVLLNNSRRDAVFKGSWSFAEKQIPFEKILKPGETQYVPVRFRLPDVREKTSFELKANVPDVTVYEPLQINVYPKPDPSGIEPFALYDTVGKTAEKLKGLGVKYQDASKLENWNGGLLVIGTESLTPDFMGTARKLRIAEKVNSGKASVLVMAQKPDALALIGLRTNDIYARKAFDAHGKMTGPWAGRSALAPNKPELDPQTEEVRGDVLWHYNNTNMISSYPVRRPSEGSFDILLACGKDLLYTPLFELNSGKGTLAFCQLEIDNRTKADPQADRILVDLLKKYAQPKPLQINEVLTKGSADEIRAKVERGANAVLDAGYASDFGVKTEKKSIMTFGIAPAGKKMFAGLSARDTYFRYPVEVTVFSGAEALTDPAFVAEKRIGKGRIIFTGFPAEAAPKEKERGLKEGPDSSKLFSAEILMNRLLQLKALASKDLGMETELFANRFESMEVPAQMIPLNYEWDFKEERDSDWRKCRVPGYFGSIHKDYGTKAGKYVYRTVVDLPEALKGKALRLEMGAVDDLDVTYANGVKIGETTEKTQGYWTAPRNYSIPAELTGSGKLEIKVVAENLRGNGGILGYARLKDASAKTLNSVFPYKYDRALYNTESWILW